MNTEITSNKNIFKLSIITICYNIKDEIARTCESIVNQTWQDFEWIVVDGGSTDGTLEVLEKYKSRINIFISEKDEGIYDAMNKGILKASGEYLNFMNGGDEFYQENVLNETISYIKNADIYYGCVNNIHEDKREEIVFFPEYLASDFFLRSNINHQSTFIKKKLFEIYGLYNPIKLHFSEVEKWILYYKNNAYFVFIPVIIANYYLGGFSKKHIVQRTISKSEYFTASEKLAHKELNEQIKLKIEIEALQTELILKQEFSYVKYYRYKILRKLMWGRTRKKYKEKYRELKNLKRILFKKS